VSDACVQIALVGGRRAVHQPDHLILQPDRQYGLINITIGQSSAPDVEKDVLSDVGSYGKQIGQVADALLVVIEHLEAHPGQALGDNKAIAAFKELMHSVATVKERHGRASTAYRPKRR
jgi:anaerobic glycerol-3-phosphate dehydrogenase